MTTRWLRVMFSLALCVLAATALAACKDDKAGGGGEEAAEEEGPASWSEDGMTPGEAVQMRLKYWMSDAHAEGNTLTPNLHFDAADNERVVFSFAPELAEQVAGLEQNKLYEVSFVYQPLEGNKLVKGKVTKIE